MYLKRNTYGVFLKTGGVRGWTRWKGYEQIGTRYVWTRKTLTVLETLDSKEWTSYIQWSQTNAVKYQLRVVFGYHDFLKVTFKECEKEIQTYLPRISPERELRQRCTYARENIVQTIILYAKIFIVPS